MKHACEMERKIATKLVDVLLDRGYAIRVFDGEENVITNSRDRAAILEAMCSTDSDVIGFHSEDGKARGWFLLIWGNAIDLISDCTDNPASDEIYDVMTEFIETTL